ncbi:IMP dehydrogenase [Candidatus Parcubacteria bacterium]|nr:IMP dehydrogenase [Candidatus Parcubacteria bacterium]
MESMFFGTTFEDFLLRPQKSVKESRKDIKRELTEMPLTRQLKIRVPLVSANMGTVTGGQMATGMALEGGVGILPRNCPLQKQLDQLGVVKRKHSYMIDNPATIKETATIGEARRSIALNKVSGLLVVDRKTPDLLVGILSHRDIPEEADNELVSNFMTPRHKIIWGDPHISIQEAEKKMFEHRVEKLPLLELTPHQWSLEESPASQESILRGLITKRDIRFLKSHPYSSRDLRGRFLVGGAVGVSTDRWGLDPITRIQALIDNGIDFILIDIAHAHWENMAKVVGGFREKYPDFPLIVGNVATWEGAQFLMELGVDAIKVGIGPGRGCRTRLETGFGVPQMQAIRECYLATRGSIPIIADGGIEHDYQIAFAILAGASTAMLGAMVAGTDESPGALIPDPITGQPMKEYRGETSPQALLEGIDPEQAAEVLEQAQSQEGQPRPVPYRGSLSKVIKRIHDHLCSVVSYAGTENLYQAHLKIRETAFQYFIRQTSSAIKESFVR